MSGAGLSVYLYRAGRQERSSTMSYSIRREFSPNRAAIVFEFDPQSEAELLRDFPWLQRIGDAAFQSHRLSGSEQAAELLPHTHHNRHRPPSAAPRSSLVMVDLACNTSIFGIGHHSLILVARPAGKAAGTSASAPVSQPRPTRNNAWAGGFRGGAAAVSRWLARPCSAQ